MSKIQSPLDELAALKILVGISTEELSHLAEVPPTRLKSALSGFSHLTIDDLSRCRKALRKCFADQQSQQATEVAV